MIKWYALHTKTTLDNSAGYVPARLSMDNLDNSAGHSRGQIFVYKVENQTVLFMSWTDFCVQSRKPKPIVHIVDRSEIEPRFSWTNLSTFLCTD
jgi:hypothetical protein